MNFIYNKKDEILTGLIVSFLSFALLEFLKPKLKELF